MRGVAAFAVNPLFDQASTSAMRLESRKSRKRLIPVGIERLQRPAPVARIRARRPITAVWRACRCSGVIGSPCTMRPSAAGGAVAKRRDGRIMGQPTGSDAAAPAVEGRQERCRPRRPAPARAATAQRCGDRIDEDRNHRHRAVRLRTASAAAERCRGRRPCSPKWPRRRRHPSTALAQSVAMSAGTLSGPGVRAVIADTLRRRCRCRTAASAR